MCVFECLLVARYCICRCLICNYFPTLSGSVGSSFRSLIMLEMDSQPVTKPAGQSVSTSEMGHRIGGEDPTTCQRWTTITTIMEMDIPDPQHVYQVRNTFFLILSRHITSPLINNCDYSGHFVCSGPRHRHFSFLYYRSDPSTCIITSFIGLL